MRSVLSKSNTSMHEVFEERSIVQMIHRSVYSNASLEVIDSLKVEVTYVKDRKSDINVRKEE